MVKVCIGCYEVNAGGFRCHVCGDRLVHTDEPEAQALPDSVWKSQRVDYGARRGMIIRFLAIFIGVGVGLYGLRTSVGFAAPWSWVGAVAAVLAGAMVWRFIYRAADRGVRLWVLHKGRVHKTRLVRAMFMSMLPSRRSR